MPCSTHETISSTCNPVEKLFFNIACDLNELNVHQCLQLGNINSCKDSSSPADIKFNIIKHINKPSSSTGLLQNHTKLSYKNLASKNSLQKLIMKEQIEESNDIGKSNSEIFQSFRHPLARIAEIGPKTHPNCILSFMQKGVSIFLYNMQYSSIKKCREIFSDIDHCSAFMSNNKNTQITYSKIIQISPRIPKTGLLDGDMDKIQLKPRDAFVITADRRFALTGNSRAIFVNCRDIICLLKPCEIINIGNIQVKIINCRKISLDCIVLIGGDLEAGIDVIFPKNRQNTQLSFEELEDIRLAIEYNINFIVTTGSFELNSYDQLKKALQPLNCNWIRILARINESDVINKEMATWLVNQYSGIILNSDSNSERRLFDFNDNIKFMLEFVHKKKISLILSWNFSKLCTMTDLGNSITCQELKYLFYYPEGILLSSNYFLDGDVLDGIFTNMYENLYCYSFQQLELLPTDGSYTGSDTVARAIVRTSCTCNVAAIILYTTSGRMAVKITNVRPKCPIIALTKSSNSIRYIQLYQNLFVANYGEYQKFHILTKNDGLFIKLIFGIAYGTSTRLIKKGDLVMFCFKSPASMSYANKFILFKVDLPIIYQLLRGAIF